MNRDGKRNAALDRRPASDRAPVVFINGIAGAIDKAARKAQRAFTCATPTLAQELEDDAKWLAANARTRNRPSTSENPRRCAGCGEWNAATREICRSCCAVIWLSPAQRCTIG